MQYGHRQSSGSVQGAGSVEDNSKAGSPQVLDPALLGRIGGGMGTDGVNGGWSPNGPHGGWSAEDSGYGPHGGWTTDLVGPHGGW